MNRSLLNLCARLEGHDLVYKQLAAACEKVEQWDELLFLAEEQGMAPLLYRHLQAVSGGVPDTFLRGLKLLCLRHRQANTFRMKTLQEILSLLNSAGIESLVLKGAVLCQTLYPEAGLRPMRDIDLLLTQEDAEHVHQLLREKGLRVSEELLPRDYFHLPALFQTVGGMEVCIELHHGLFPDDPPYYKHLPFAELCSESLDFTVNDVPAKTLGTEDMLWHLYQHGFHAPLTFEPYKLISAADIISLVEKNVEQLDWDKIRTVFPHLFRALPLFHHISPWHEKLAEKFVLPGGTSPPRVGESFVGWPRSKFMREDQRGFWKVVGDTFFPGSWWLRIYYGVSDSRFSIIMYRMIFHPIHILRWAKVYGIRFLKRTTQRESGNREGAKTKTSGRRCGILPDEDGK